MTKPKTNRPRGRPRGANTRSALFAGRITPSLLKAVKLAAKANQVSTTTWIWEACEQRLNQNHP